MNKYDRRHIANVRLYQQQIDRIFKIAAEESAALAAGLAAPEDGLFSFASIPRLKSAIDELQAQMASHLEMTVADGVREEWRLSNAKNDALATSALPLGNRPARYFRSNEEAREAFLGRKERGLALSDRVWRYTDQFKAEIEMGIDCGLRDGIDAAQMARQLKQYLQHPDKLFRRVRDEHGNLQLSKAAAAFHPGQGVYRSSYKNARRLAATETNIAYHTADHLRWQQLDFVVGIEVHLSNNHTCLGKDGAAHPFFDICDELQGRYPKEFKFTGWHPHCRCIATAILKTEQEMEADDERILNGEQPTGPSESDNAVADLPDNFTRWVDDNQERIERARTLPYFLRDNFVDGDPNKGAVWQTGQDKPNELTDEQRERRNNERINELRDAIQNGLLPADAEDALRWIEDSNALNDFEDAEMRISRLEKAVARHAARTDADVRRIQDTSDERNYGKAYVDNVHEIEKRLGMERVKRMTHEEANLGNVNPNYGKGDRGYHINCSTCSGVYILRRMGFDLEARPNRDGTLVRHISLGINSWSKWIDGANNFTPTDEWMRAKGYKQMNKHRYMEFIRDSITGDGIYEMSIGWKGSGGLNGHSFLIAVDGDDIRLIEQQNAATRSTLYDYCENGSPKVHNCRGIMRVDTAMFDPDYLGVAKKSK